MSDSEYKQKRARKQTCSSLATTDPGSQKRPHGEDHPNHKLSVADVREIRRRSADGVPKTRLAADYGVSLMTIKAILSGTAWKGVK